MFNDPPPGYAYPQFYPQAQQFQPFIPNLGQFSQTSPVMASLIQMGMQSMMGGGGSAMMGISDQNLMDRFRQSYYTRQHYGVMEDMANLDRPAMKQVVATGYAMMNRPFDASAQQAIDFASQAWPHMAPVMASMAPEMTDSLFGMRGSAAVFGAGVAQAARGRLNPTTGLIGMDRDQISGPNGLGRAVWDEMFAGNRYLSSPLSAGDAGQLWRELQSQGLMAGTSTLEDLHGRNSPALQRAMRDKGFSGRSWEGLSAGERDQLLSAPDVQAEIKAFDTQKVSGTLREWGKSIEAMKEIFGDAGMPNAPIPVLMQALRQLTSGGLTQMNQGELSTMVRSFSSLAQSSGLGMQGASMLVQVGEGQANRFGLPGVFAPQASMETMAYMTAYGAMGRGQYGGWGNPDINTLAQARQQLNISGRASTAGNQVGLAYRTEQEFGPFKAGSKMAAWMDAIKHGQSTFSGGESVSMQDAAFAEMMAEGTGQSANEVQMRLGQTYENSSGLYYHPEAMRSVRALQREETRAGLVGNTAAGTIGALLGDTFGMGSQEAQLGSFLGRSFSNIFMDSKRFNPSWGAKGNEKLRNEGIANAMYSDLKAAAQDPNNPDHESAQALLRSRSESDLKGMLGHWASDAWGDVDQEARRRNTTAIGLQRLHDPAIEAEALKVENAARAEGVVGGLLERAGKGGIIRRFMEGMMSGDVTNLTDLSKLGLGKVDEEGLRKLIGSENINEGNFKDFRQKFSRVRELKAQLTMGGETAKKAQEELATMDADEHGIVQIISRMNQYAEAHGIDLGSTLYASGTLGAANERLLGFVGKEGAEFSKWLPTGVGNVKKELAEYRKSDAFKNLKDADKRIGEIEGLLDQAASAASPEAQHEKLQQAASKLGELKKEEAQAEENKPTVVTSTNVYFNGAKVEGGAKIVVGGNSTTSGPVA